MPLTIQFERKTGRFKIPIRNGDNLELHARVSDEEMQAVKYTPVKSPHALYKCLLEGNAIIVLADKPNGSAVP